MSKENARRSQSQHLITAAAIAAITSGVSLAFAQVPTIDGTRDALYGSPVATQVFQTGFGDNQSELDAGYAYIKDGKLHLFLAGNLESNNNKLALFFDTRAGGQNVMRADNPDVNFNNINTKYAGMTFDAGFSPDYGLFFSRDRDGGTLEGNIYVDFTELNTNGGGFGGFAGQVHLPANQIGSGTVGDQNGFPRVTIGYDDSNTAGVGGGSNALTPAEVTAAQAVATGAEIVIDLAAFGATENFTMMVGINGSNHDYWSNQFLAPIQSDGVNPQGNLGGDGLGNFTGTVGAINFNNHLGNQFFSLNYHAPLSNWNNAAGSNWNNAANWTSDGVPNSIDARAVLGTLAGSAARTISLGINVTLASLTFDSPGTYTIGAGGGRLAIRGNASTPSILVNAGSHVINAPVDLQATTNATVATGSTLTIADLTATGQALVKAGGGVLQVNRVRGNALAVNEGTVRIATNGGDSGASEMGNLSFGGGFAAPTGTLNLSDNDLVVHKGSPEDAAATYTNLTTAIAFARNGGAWNRAGLTSSAAASAVPKNKTLGTATGAEYHTAAPGAAFSGITVADTDVLVKFTYYGDTDLNGQVNFDDYSRTDAGFNNQRTGWFNGDFDYNGTVNFDDYSLIDAAFNTQSGSLRRAMSFLEGSDRDQTTMDTPALQVVLEHYSQFGDGYAQGFLNAVPEPTGVLVFSGIAALMAGRRRRAR
ncbi:hypothetical protein BH09PLA1_BH09PLA1_18220 [soil metagenome]